MSTMIIEVYDALIEAGASEQKAKAAAQVIPDMKQVATKADLKVLEHKLTTQIQQLRPELSVLKFAVFSLYPFILAIAYRVFS